jgi:hypothetical protein
VEKLPDGTVIGDSLQAAEARYGSLVSCTQGATYEVHGADAPPFPLVFFDMNPLLFSSNQLHFGGVAVLVHLADIEAALS